VFGKDGLIALGVFGRVGVFDVGGQRHVAVALHQGVRVAGQAQPKQRPVGVGPAPEQRSGEGGLPIGTGGHAQHGAGGGLFAHLHVCHHLAVAQHALDQQFQLAARGFFAEQARLDHLRIVEHQQVARLQQRGQVAKGAVRRRPGAAIEQARGAALRCGVLGDELGWQLEVEVARAPRALGGGGVRDHALEGRTGPYQVEGGLILPRQG